MTTIPLLVAHVLLVTAGYGGLIAADAYLLFLSASRDAEAVLAGVRAWQRTARVFGPMLGLGVLCGIGLALTLQVPPASLWLVWTYVLVIAAIAVQALVMIPWQRRAAGALAGGTMPSLGVVRVALVALAVFYSAIMTLMLVRPS
ncbi:MAG TPA: hypothetical protein VMF61_06495 [Candidatus Acidoferrales bacterium]|nr:hypothetical protein [Candidatus Acidoferrales bacterium]